VFNVIRNFEKLGDAKTRADLAKVLKPKAQNYRYLSDKMKTTNEKQLARRRNILVQSGSGFPAILGAVLPLLVNLIAGK
jgi:hypothetical protein